jgi:nucleoside-triphosphatase
VKNILLEGVPGVGKTTLVQKLAEGLSTFGIGGFYTREIRENFKRIGFMVETFDGQSAILAHVKYNSGPQVGKYRVDISAFERVGVSGLEKALNETSVILIDEIGKMELFSQRFRAILRRCFDSDKIVLATIMSRSHPYADRVKMRSDAKLYRITLENRNQLVQILTEEIHALC